MVLQWQAIEKRILEFHSKMGGLSESFFVERLINGRGVYEYKRMICNYKYVAMIE